MGLYIPLLFGNPNLDIWLKFASKASASQPNTKSKGKAKVVAAGGSASQQLFNTTMIGVV